MCIELSTLSRLSSPDYKGTFIQVMAGFPALLFEHHVPTR